MGGRLRERRRPNVPRPPWPGSRSRPPAFLTQGDHITALDADEISRVTLLHLTDGSAESLEAAERLVETRRLSLRPTAGAINSAAGQAAVLTAAVTAVRTFGTVHVTLPADVRVIDGAHRGRWLSEALCEEGTVSDPATSSSSSAVIVLGNDADVAGVEVPQSSGGIVLHASWDDWIATVSPTPRPVGDDHNVLAAIAAAAMAVSEAFAHSRCIPGSDAGYRVMHLDLLGQSTPAAPALRYAPASWWLVGLGHLGQAYAWVIAHLPYADPATVEVTVQDTDLTSAANHSTSVLTPRHSRGVPKTRLVAGRLEGAGFRTRIIERPLDAEFRLRVEETLTVALIGVDNLPSRRALSSVGWPLTIDMGLGAQTHDHTAISMHRFPASKASQQIPAWQERPSVARPIPVAPGFADLDARFEHCGVVTLAGKAIGVPFIGVIAATLAVTEALKQLHGIPGNEVLSIDAATGHHVSSPGARHDRISQTDLLQPQRRCDL